MNVIESLGEWSAITSNTAIGEATKQREPVQGLVASDDQTLSFQKLFRRKAQVLACKNKSWGSHGFHPFFNIGFFFGNTCNPLPIASRRAALICSRTSSLVYFRRLQTDLGSETVWIATNLPGEKKCHEGKRDEHDKHHTNGRKNWRRQFVKFSLIHFWGFKLIFLLVLKQLLVCNMTTYPFIDLFGFDTN